MTANGKKVWIVFVRQLPSTTTRQELSPEEVECIRTDEHWATWIDLRDGRTMRCVGDIKIVEQ